MIPGTPRRLRFGSPKPEAEQIKLIDKRIDHPNRIVFADELVKTFGK